MSLVDPKILRLPYHGGIGMYYKFIFLKFGYQKTVCLLFFRLRLILHGRLLVSVKTLKLQLHTTLDPYNTAEEAELTFHDANFDWTNGMILYN